MKDFSLARQALLGALCTLAAACSAPAAAPARTTLSAGAPHAHAHAHDASDHNHPRGKMLLASDGKVDALLTAHLSSKDGNELDVFVEQHGEPYALSVKTLAATASVSGGEKLILSFACAPAHERPASEPEGMCSHFVASAPWMKPTDVLRVDTTLPLAERQVPMAWRGFEPKAYAHHQD